LILLGRKTVEVRSRRTSKKGERVYIYAGGQRLETKTEARIAEEFAIDVDGLPRGFLVGTIEIVGCEPVEPRHSKAACISIAPERGGFAWILAKPERAKVLRKPEKHPQPSFFDPF
jgi:hypothetical protein